MTRYGGRQRKWRNSPISSLQDRQSPACDPVLARRFEFLPKIFCITTARDRVAVQADNPSRGGRVVVEECDSQVPDTTRDEQRKVLRRRLRDGVIKSVSATHICLEWVIDPC